MQALSIMETGECGFARLGSSRLRSLLNFLPATRWEKLLFFILLYEQASRSNSIRPPRNAPADRTILAQQGVAQCCLDALVAVLMIFSCCMAHFLQNCLLADTRLYSNT